MKRIIWSFFVYRTVFCYIIIHIKYTMRFLIKKDLYILPAIRKALNHQGLTLFLFISFSLFFDHLHAEQPHDSTHHHGCDKRL